MRTVKIIVRTPKNQAKKCINTQRNALLSYKLSKLIIEEKVVAHNKFYWVLCTNTDKDYDDLLLRVAKGEILIKKFYKMLFSIMDRCNKLLNKWAKGWMWAKRWVTSKLRKLYKGSDTNEMLTQIEAMTEEEWKDFFNVTDREEMKKLMSGELISVETVSVTDSEVPL